MVLSVNSNLGKQTNGLSEILSADGDRTFPYALQESEEISQPEDALFTITKEDVREEAKSCLSRELTGEEIPAVREKFKKNLEYLDWRP